MTRLSLSKIEKARVLVIGDVMLDRYWYGSVDRISPEAPVPVVRVTRQEERMGAAANVAYNAACLGAQVSLLTVVGDDDASHQLQALVSAAKIQACFERDPQQTTTIKLRVIGRQQQLLRLDFENTPSHTVLARQAMHFEKLQNQHDVVLFSDYDKGNLHQITSMIERVRHCGKPTLVDPKGTDYGRYRGASVLTPNCAELKAVIGPWCSEEELHTKAHNLRTSLQLEALLLTRSEEGMSLFDEQGHLHVPTVARDVFDVTGAGDTVIATVATMLAAGMTLRQAVVVANTAAGIVVGKFGTAAVSYDELNQALIDTGHTHL